MSDDEIDFSDEAMFATSKPTPPPLAPLRAQRVSVFTPAEVRRACEARGIVVTAEPTRTEDRASLAIEWKAGDLVIREHVGGALWTGDGADRRLILHDRSALPPVAAMVPRCPHCGFAYGIASHTRIVRRNRRDEEMTFCSVACGGDFQMGCEG